MANQTLLTNNLTDNQVVFHLENSSQDNPPTNANNNPSTFNLTIEPTYYLNEFGIYDGFCIQPWLPITPSEYSADVYYSIENFEINTLVDLNEDGNIDEPFILTDEMLQKSVFTLNNLTWADKDGDGDLEGTITDGNGNILNPTDDSGNFIDLEVADIQYLLWFQIYGLYAPDYALGFDQTPYASSSFITEEQTRGIDGLGANLTENLANSITEAMPDNFTPNQAGDKVGVILIPDTGEQFILSTVELSGLGDFVWFDQNKNGIQDDHENGIEGVTVQLLADLNNDDIIDIDEVLETTTTDADGFYSFEGIIADDYRVRFVNPEGTILTTPNLGDDDGIDSDAAPNSGLSEVISLTPGEFNETIDAGLVFGSIGDSIFFDNNNNGVMDAGEGLAGVRVNLDIDGDNNFDLFEITDSQGMYLFENLVAGNYTVMVDTTSLPEELVNTVDPDGDNNNMSLLSLNLGEDNLDQDFGYQIPDWQPDIDLEQMVNGIDANDPSEYPALVPGEPVLFSYHVTNTGNMPFLASEVIVTDNNGTADDTSDDFNPEQVFLNGNGFNVGDTNQNNILDPAETWKYSATKTVETISNDDEIISTSSSNLNDELEEVGLPDTIQASSNIYEHLATVEAEGVFDTDVSGYMNQMNQTDSGCEELSFEINQPISGASVDVLVILKEILGGVEFNVSVVDDEVIGDIRAVFFNIADDSLVNKLGVSGDDVTDYAFKANQIDKELGQDANIKGGGNKYKYDAGVEIGTQGKSKDDIQSTIFTISHATEELDIEDFLNQGFAVRLTSVGAPFGGREDSSKLVGISPEECISADDNLFSHDMSYIS